MNKQLFSYFGKGKKFIILGFICSFIDVMAELALPLYIAEIIDVGIVNNDSAHIIKNGLIMIGLTIIAISFGSANIYCSAKAAFGASFALRKDMFSRIQQFSFANIDQFSTASLITRMTNDINQIQSIILMGLRILARAPLLFIMALIMAININAGLATILLIVAPLMLVSVLLIMRLVQKRYAHMQKCLDDLNSDVQENLMAIRLVKAFNRAKKEIEKFASVNNAYFIAGFEADKIMILLMPVIMLFFNFAIIAALWLGGQLVAQNLLGAGLLMSFITYIMQILGSLLMFLMFFVMSGRAKASGERIMAVLNTKPDIVSPAQYLHPAEQGITDNNYKLEFRQLSFNYHTNPEQEVLSDISLKLKPGQKLAIIGATGSGKSSLVQLIPRLYDTISGQVLVDNQDVRDYQLADLRQKVALVRQKSQLFSGTIRENLLWGNPHADDSQIKEACRIAQAEEFIIKLSDGYDTMLGQQGVNISGGQKQRLSIARAILKKPDILILDDSTSALDSRIEQKLLAAFYQQMPTTTLIMIAQRISSIIAADLILVLADGKIAGLGNHQQLLAENQIYQEIFASQHEEVAV